MPPVANGAVKAGLKLPRSKRGTWLLTLTSSLLYSRYQPHEAIAAKGRDLSGNGGPEFIYRDFRVDWQEGIERSRTWAFTASPIAAVFSAKRNATAKSWRGWPGQRKTWLQQKK